MSRRGILAVSLCINLALVTAVAFAIRRAAAPVMPPPSNAAMTNPAQPAAVSSEAGPNFITNRFHWSQVESADYQQYLANLRAIGCPEKTVRDILVRDIEKTFALRMARRRPGPTNFWACGADREAAEARHRQDLAGLRREQRELTRRLLGIDYVKRSSDFDDLAGRAILMFLTGTTRDQAVEKIVDIFKHAEAARDEIRESADGFVTPAQEAELAKNHLATLEELKAALSPAELEEFGLRFAAIRMMDGGFDDFKCTAAELRAMASAYYHTIGFGGLDFELFDGRQKLPDEKQDELQARLKEALGERRYDELLRETDDDYRALTEFVSGAKLPATLATALFDVRRLAQREHSRIVADASLAGAVRHAQLQEVRQATTEAVRTQLGEAGYQDYVKRGLAKWIEELCKP